MPLINATGSGCVQGRSGNLFWGEACAPAAPRWVGRGRILFRASAGCKTRGEGRSGKQRRGQQRLASTAEPMGERARIRWRRWRRRVGGWLVLCFWFVAVGGCVVVSLGVSFFFL